MIDWGAATTSAGTAIVVTLVVEYFAKPRLEARKERILSQFRARRDLLTAITKIALAAQAVSTEIPYEADPTTYQTLKDEQARQYQRLKQQVNGLIDEADIYIGTYVGPVRALVVGCLSYLHGVMLSARSQQQQGELTFSAAQSIAMLLDPPPAWHLWRWPARIRAWEELRRLVDVVSPQRMLCQQSAGDTDGAVSDRTRTGLRGAPPTGPLCGSAHIPTPLTPRK